MQRRGRLLTALVGIALVLTPAGVAQAQPAAGGPARTIDWAPCEADPSAQCGTLSVPVDWSRPAGEAVELALVRRPATDPSARIGPLLVNPGGPGGSGAGMALSGYGHFSDELRRRFDIVGVDPRGVAGSNEVLCSLDLLLNQPGPLPADQAGFEAMVGFNRGLSEDCRSRTGPVFDYLDTISVVDDLDAVRAALGEQQVSFYGISYGTLIGQQYAERYPSRVRAAALVGVMDHSLGTRQFVESQAVAVQTAFDAFVDWCDRTPRCALHDADVPKVFADLRARARAGELPMPGDPGATLTEYGLISGTFRAFYGPDWPWLAEELALMRASGPGATGWSASSWQDGPPEAVGYPFPAIFCQDWRLPVRDVAEYDRHLRRMAELAPDMGYAPTALNLASCQGWTSEVRNPQRPTRVPPGPRLLLVNAAADPATGYNWATSVARQLGPSGRLLTYEGGGHSIYRASDCVTGAVDRYLVSGVLPAPGARCAAVDPAVPATVQGPRHQRPPHPGPDAPIWGVPAH